MFTFSAPQEASRRLHPSGKVFLIRGVSPDIAARFPNGSLDFIYIDAKHDYSSVLADLLAFWPKLPPGGILAGHDFQVLLGCACVSAMLTSRACCGLTRRRDIACQQRLRYPPVNADL